MSKFNSFNKNIGRLGVLTAITLSLLRCNSPANTQKNNDEQTKGLPFSKTKAPANTQKNNNENPAPLANTQKNNNESPAPSSSDEFLKFFS